MSKSLLYKVVSGGQTGVDQAALRAALAGGLATGGWMPKGCLTEAGPRPDLAELHGLQTTATADYGERTRANVRDSDGAERPAPHLAPWYNRPPRSTTFHGIKGPRAMVIEVTDMGVKGGPTKVQLDVSTVAQVYLGSERMVPSIRLRDGRQMYIAEDLARMADELRRHDVIVTPARA